MLEKTSDIFLAFLQRNGMVAIVILAVLAVRLLLRKCPKKYSYWLWAIVGIRMLFELPVSSGFSLFNLLKPLEKGTEAVGIRLQPANNITAEPHSSAVLQNTGIATGQQTFSSEVTPTMTGSERVFSVLFFVWIAGIVLMLLYGIYSYAKCRKLVEKAVILRQPQSAEENYKLPRRASVWECDGIPSPFVIGIFHPQIYIPFRMKTTEQQYILAHESCHIRRLDPLWKLLAFVLLAAYWWNPLVWVAFFYMTRDMEMSCDEAVIASFGNTIKKGYSESLLTFAMKRHPYSFAPIAFGEGDAGKRIKNVLNFKKPRIWITIIVIAVLAVVAVCCLTNRNEFVCGTYVYEHNEESNFELTNFSITFHEDGTYEYYEGPLSSYIGFGTYSIENDILTMHEGGYDNWTNCFRIKGKRICFIEDKSDNFTYVHVKNNQGFLLTKDVDKHTEYVSSDSSEISSTDANNEQDISRWAKAFCERDVNTILELTSKDAQNDLKAQQLLQENDFGWSSPWPWAINPWATNPESEEDITDSYLIQSADFQAQTAEIIYYARTSDPHVTVWKESIHYGYQGDKFLVIEEELHMYDNIASGWDFGIAYSGINGTPMDYATNGVGAALNEQLMNQIEKDPLHKDPLQSPIPAARRLLNLLNNENKVQLECVYEGEDVCVRITFLLDGSTWEVKMVQPWGENGIWVPQDPSR